MGTVFSIQICTIFWGFHATCVFSLHGLTMNCWIDHAPRRQSHETPITCWSDPQFVGISLVKNVCWLVVWNIAGLWLSIQFLWMSSSQLTFIFFRGVGQPPASLTLLYFLFVFASDKDVWRHNAEPPSDVCWFITPVNYTYRYHKP